MTDFQVFFDPDGCFLVTEQAVLCGQCGSAHYLFRNGGGKTVCLECAGTVVDSLAKLKQSVAQSTPAAKLEEVIDHVHSVMTARVEDIGMNFYAKEPPRVR